MTRQSTTLQITQIGPTTWLIRGYTKPYTDDLKAAGATWDAKTIGWRFAGSTLPPAISALVKGLTTLEVSAPALVLVGGDGVTLALKQTVTVGDNPIVGLIVDLNVKAGKVCVTRPNPSATTNMTHWVAANKVKQAESPIGEKTTLDTDATQWGKAVRAQEKRAREAMEAAKSDPAKVDAALDEIVKAVEIGQARPAPVEWRDELRERIRVSGKPLAISPDLEQRQAVEFVQFMLASQAWDGAGYVNLVGMVANLHYRMTINRFWMGFNRPHHLDYEILSHDPAAQDAAESASVVPPLDFLATAREALRSVRDYVESLPRVPKDSLGEGELLLDMSPSGSLWQMVGWDGDTPLLRPRLVKQGARHPRSRPVWWDVNWRRVTTSEAAWIARLQRAYRDVTKRSLKKPIEPARIVYAAYESDEFPDYDWGSAPRQVDVIDEALYPRYSIGEKVFTRPGNHPAIVREVFADNRYEVFDGFGLCVLHADWLIKNIIFPPTGPDVWTARAVPGLLPAKLPDDTWVTQVNTEARRLDHEFVVNANRLASTGARTEIVSAVMVKKMKPINDSFVELASGGTLKSVEDLIATKTDDPTSSWWIDENDHVFHIDNPPPMDAFAILRGPFDTEAEARAMLKPKRSSSAFKPPSDVTPLRQQYLDIKAQYPECILFFRLGDFYELFDEDAELAAKELDLVLTSRPVNRKQRVPMAGVPHHALEPHVTKLVEKGYHVAVCEQVSEPNGGGLVERRVERLVEPCQKDA